MLHFSEEERSVLEEIHYNVLLSWDFLLLFNVIEIEVCECFYWDKC